MIIIVDYGQGGNLLSIRNMLKSIGLDSVVSDKPETILNASHLILPGVGAYDTGMQGLNAHNKLLLEVLNQKVIVKKTPILGICLGMQLMLEKSDEGSLCGLGWIKGFVRRIPEQINGQSIRTPHIGWNYVNSDSELFRGLPKKRFYFVHSYYCDVEQNEQEIAIGLTKYGLPFCSHFEKDSIVGVQFHPEKSHHFGKEFFRNYFKKY